MKNDMEKIAEQMASQELTKHALTLLTKRIAYDAERDRARNAEELKRWQEEGVQRQAMLEQLYETKLNAATFKSLQEENAALKAANTKQNELDESIKDLKKAFLLFELNSDANAKELRDEIEKLKTENAQFSDLKSEVKKLKSRMTAVRGDLENLSGAACDVEDLFERVEDLERAAEEDDDEDEPEEFTAAAIEAQQ